MYSEDMVTDHLVEPYEKALDELAGKLPNETTGREEPLPQ